MAPIGIYQIITFLPTYRCQIRLIPEIFTDWELDVDCLRRMVNSPLRGALLANEVGTGKTLTFMAERYYAIQDREAKLAEFNIQETDDATEVGLPKSMPTLLMAPASLIEQHFLEINKYFAPGTFEIRVFHGSASNTSHNPALQQCVMTTETLLAEMSVAVEQSKTSQVSTVCSCRYLLIGARLGYNIIAIALQICTHRCQVRPEANIA